MEDEIQDKPEWANAKPGTRKVSSTFDERLAQQLSEGWKITSDGPTGVQLEGSKKMKTATKVAYFIGFLTCFFGIGIVILIAAYIDDRNTKPETIFLRRNGEPSIIGKEDDQVGGKTTKYILLSIIGFLLLIIFLAMIFAPR